MLTVIKRNVCIQPKYLDKNINTHILKKLQDSTRGECSKKNGHILEVTRIVENYGNRISSANSDIIFDIEFEAKVVKPEQGQIMEGIVCMISKDGIFVQIENVLKILIPPSSLSEYELDPTSSFYSKDEDTIERKDTVKVKISATKYSKKKFSVIGSLV